MKKIIAIICLVILSFTAVSCSGGKNEIPVDDGTKTISREVETVADEYIVRKGSCDYVIVTENAFRGYTDRRRRVQNFLCGSDGNKSLRYSG